MTLNIEKQSWKEQEVWRFIASDFKIYYKLTLIRTVWYWHEDNHRSMDENWESEINLLICGQLVFHRWCHKIQWRKYNLFNIQCWGNWISTYKRMKFDSYLTPYPKINSKWIKDLNVRAVTTMLLENIVVNFHNLRFSNGFLDMTQKAWETKEKIDFIKIKNF